MIIVINTLIKLRSVIMHDNAKKFSRLSALLYVIVVIGFFVHIIGARRHALLTQRFSFSPLQVGSDGKVLYAPSAWLVEPVGISVQVRYASRRAELVVESRKGDAWPLALLPFAVINRSQVDLLVDQQRIALSELDQETALRWAQSRAPAVSGATLRSAVMIQWINILLSCLWLVPLIVLCFMGVVRVLRCFLMTARLRTLFENACVMRSLCPSCGYELLCNNIDYHCSECGWRYPVAY